MPEKPKKNTEYISSYPIDRIVPYARNARTHSPEQINKIVQSIKEFGFTNPVLIDSKDGIIAGHGRVMAAARLEMKEVPVIRLHHLSDAQKRAYIIADNKIALGAGWDVDMLRLELEALKIFEFDLELTGFDEAELADLMTDSDIEDADKDPDFVPQKSSIRPGDVVLLGAHRLVVSDSVDNCLDMDYIIESWEKFTGKEAKKAKK